MEENKVTLKLSDYLNLYNENNELRGKLNELLSLLINNTELSNNKKQLQMDVYNCKYGRLIDLIKELKPEEYKKRYEALIQDEED